MIGREKGFVAPLEKERINSGSSTMKLVKAHCIIHQENLCPKSLRMQSVMEIVVKTVNFIRARGLNHRQFRKLLDEMDSQYGDLLYYTEVRWLSKGAMLRRFYELKEEVFHFMEEKGKPVFHLNDPLWFYTGVYAIEINSLRKEFENRFKDLRSNIVNFAIFSNPFSLEPIELPEHLQLELVDMQCNQDLKAKFNDVTLMDFYQKYLSSSDYPNLIKHCKMMACLFGSTYICE
ncbi:General transcription factor II-I repeat domain-containing protein 2-like [Oopsacas minuta]|uniref:General transcription factor II-I repeat domain-containing protein 2-like n=1 Tax=Oopsacas minuta TaxID=111878 RepID=A0AAV7K2Y7_9METZ|nr:General transcription factor II-I repeat domain-containing protein 2-like [Oopsacas minuta]